MNIRILMKVMGSKVKVGLRRP